MRLLTISGLTAILAGVVFGQSPFSNPVKPMPVPINAAPYGNVLFPGGTPGRSGHTLPSGGTSNGTRPYHGGTSGRLASPNHNRTVVVPYAVPAWYGGGYGYTDPGYQAGYQEQSPNVTVVVPQQPTPSVIINQTFTPGESGRAGVQEYSSTDVPDNTGVRVYEPGRPGQAPQTRRYAADAPPQGASYVRDDKANIYLIALKNSTVRQAIGYWVEGKTLSFVTPDARIDHVNLEMVDREASVQLNAERKLDFDLKGN